MQRVVECVGASNLVLKTLSRNNKGQQFFLDAFSQTIKSQQWKDRSMTIQSNGASTNLYMTTTNARWFQLFRLEDDFLTNDHGKVMTITNDLDSENNNIGIWAKNNKIGQTWDIVYADEMPPPLKKGELNKDWGFKINTPFHVISNLPDGRYIDVVANKLVIKRRNGLKGQEWYFDQVSRTIKSALNNQSWTIE